MLRVSSRAQCSWSMAAIPRNKRGDQSMSARDAESDSRVAYRQPQPVEMAPDLLVSPALPSDERIWVPQAPNVWFRPLCLSASQGYWVNLLKVTRAGVLSRHR